VARGGTLAATLPDRATGMPPGYSREYVQMTSLSRGRVQHQAMYPENKKVYRVGKATGDTF